MNAIRRQVRWYAPQQQTPVTKKELNNLAKEGQGALLAAINRFQKGNPGVTPRQVNEHLYEIRVQVGNNHFRALMFKDSPVHYVIVRVFFKNTQKTPPGDIDAALKRMNQWKAKNS